jgi:hypothetical protein
VGSRSTSGRGSWRGVKKAEVEAEIKGGAVVEEEKELEQE